MTPEAQRKYDLDLAASMIRLANWVEPRSRRISSALMLGAQRIQALSGGVPVSSPDPDKHQAMPIVGGKKDQPASTPSDKR